VCTSAAARGLDLPAVSHVYNLGVPPDTAQYIHRAGRAGRIGSTSGNCNTSM
jgi:superfamily II DNA/RNA helicase